MNDLDALLRLQNTDFDLYKLRKELAELPGVRKKPEAGLAQMKGLEPKVAEGLAAAKGVVKAKEGEVADLQDKKKKLENRLQQATTAKMAEATQAEIAKLDEKIEAAEEAVLEAMEKEEEAQGMADKVAGGISTLEKQLADFDANLPGKTKALEEKIASAEADRERWRSKVVDEPSLVEKYDKLKERAKPGQRIVVEVDEACSACDRSFTGDEREILMAHAQEVNTCKSCGAMMIYVGAVGLT